MTTCKRNICFAVVLIAFTSGCVDDSPAPVRSGSVSPKLHTADPSNGGRPTLSWDAVPQAIGYQLYLKIVDTDLGLVPPSEAQVTTADTKIGAISSPYDLQKYNRCHTAYLFAVAPEFEEGEGALSATIGYGVGGCAR